MQGIYILTNTVNGKQYVGLDSRLPERAYVHLNGHSHCPAICGAVNKYGKEAFEVQIIEYPGISREALQAVERWKIAQLNTKAPNGYNLTDGGDGVSGLVISEQRKQELSEQWRGKNNPNYGKSLSPETRHKISRALSGENHPNYGKSLSKETRRKIGDAHRGKEISVEHRKIVSESTQRRIADGSLQQSVRDMNLKRIADGTHHFLDIQHQRYAAYKSRLVAKDRRRKFYQLFAALLTSKSVLESWLYRKRQREGFFDVDIPDTGRAVQQRLF